MPVTTRSQANTDANQGNGRPQGKMFVSSIQIQILSHKARTRSSKTQTDLLSTRQKRTTLSSASRRSQTKYVSSGVPCPNDDKLSTNDSIPTNSYNTPTSTHGGSQSPPTIRRTCSRTSRPTWAG